MSFINFNICLRAFQTFSQNKKRPKLETHILINMYGPIKNQEAYYNSSNAYFNLLNSNSSLNSNSHYILFEM